MNYDMTSSFYISLNSFQFLGNLFPSSELPSTPWKVWGCTLWIQTWCEVENYTNVGAVYFTAKKPFSYEKKKWHHHSTSFAQGTRWKKFWLQSILTTTSNWWIDWISKWAIYYVQQVPLRFILISKFGGLGQSLIKISFWMKSMKRLQSIV